MHLATLFCPAAAGWFAGRFAAPTPAQVRAWPAIAANRHTLISAPTGSGKTLAAFLAAIDGLIRQGLEGRLTDAPPAAPPGAWRGEVIMAGAVLCMALYNVFSRPFIQRSSALGFLALGMGTGALALILVGGFSGSIGVLREFNTPEWIAGIYLGVAGGALAFILWVLALQRATPTRVANTMTVNPIAAASLAAVLVGEPITLSLVGGLVAVFAGIWISTSERGQNRWLVQTR